MEGLIQTLLGYARLDIKNGHESADFDLVAYEAELRQMDELELLNRKHPCCKSHCCIYHGCKYSHDDCPVFTGKVRQTSTCETCSMYDGVESVDEAIALSQGAADREFLRELSKRAAKYNNPVVDAFVAKMYSDACVDSATNQENSDGELRHRDW